jgi:DNA-binding Lrp family transcriptional regulator
MDAYVYLQVEAGSLPQVLAALSSKQGVRRAVGVIGEWDVLVHAEGADLNAIVAVVISELHQIPGVARSVTAPVVPADRIGVTGFGGPKPPPIIPDACYVHIRAEAGATASIAERLTDMPDIAGVAVLGGSWDLLTCVAQPWEVASGVILEDLHAIPGVVATSTLVSLTYDEPEEERDQFSSWS